MNRFMLSVATLCAGSLLGAGAGAAPAQAGTIPTLRSAVISNTSPTVAADRGCSYGPTLTVKYHDPDQLLQVGNAVSSVSATFVGGANWDTGSPLASRSGAIITFTARAVLCGYLGGENSPAQPPGRYLWSLEVWYSGSALVNVERSFHLRHLAQIRFNATPEPVRKGGYVTLTASIHDRWESSATTRVSFYFRAYGTPRYVYKGSVVSKCLSNCGNPNNLIAAKMRTKQHRSGIWKAVSTQTSWVSSATGFDAVSVRH